MFPLCFFQWLKVLNLYLLAALTRTTDPQCITSYNRLINAETIQQTALSQALEKARSKGEKEDSKAVQSLLLRVLSLYAF